MKGNRYIGWGKTFSLAIRVLGYFSHIKHPTIDIDIDFCLKELKGKAVNGTYPMTQLRDVTCHMDHTVLPAT